MIPLEEAQARLLALVRPVASETIQLSLAVGRYAASDIHALRTQPARDLSAMDGYAIRFADADGPWKVIGESAAGVPFSGAVEPKQAVRIFTGAAVPEGADTVIMQENVTRSGDNLTLIGDSAAKSATNVRRAGSDFAQGDVLAAAGTRLIPAHIGLIALAGHATVSVHRYIKVALLSTGDELLPLGAPCDEAHIPASNAIMLAALLVDTPTEVRDLGIIADDLDAITAAIHSANEVDILVTIGGASVGAHDLVRPALQRTGAQIDFWKVAMRPGKPLMAGTLGDQAVLGLPGNPVSAYVTALLFLKPLIAALSGACWPLPQRQTCTLGAPLGANGNRTDHVRARLENGVVTPLSSQDSAGLMALSRANVLIARQPLAPPASKGDQVSVINA